MEKVLGGKAFRTVRVVRGGVGACQVRGLRVQGVWAPVNRQKRPLNPRPLNPASFCTLNPGSTLEPLANKGILVAARLACGPYKSHMPDQRSWVLISGTNASLLRTLNSDD